MNRRVYVRPLLDKFTGTKYHISVTGDTAGSVPHRVVEGHEELLNAFQRASLGRLIVGIDDAVSKRQDYDSGPMAITQEQENILLGRG